MAIAEKYSSAGMFLQLHHTISKTIFMEGKTKENFSSFFS